MSMNIRVVAIAFLLGTLSASAFAHHGWSTYTNTDFTLTGVVVDTRLGRPHDRLIVEAGGEQWNVVMSPPNRSQRAGFDDTVVKVGDTVTMLGNRHANPQTFEMKTRRINVHSKDYDLYPSRL
jgi:hypothetical protein